MIVTEPDIAKYIEKGAKLLALLRKRGRYHIGDKVTIKICDKRFKGKVISTKELNLYTLFKYVDYCGCCTVFDWIYEAIRLYKGKVKLYELEIVLIELINNDS